MIIPLLLLPYRIPGVPPALRAENHYNDGRPFWRVRIFSFVLHERCPCDTVQDCEVWRFSGMEEWDDEDTGEHFTYDPRVDCKCRAKPPHHHTWLGWTIDRPVRQTW